MVKNKKYIMRSPFTSRFFYITICVLSLLFGKASANVAVDTTPPPFATSTYNNAYYNSVLEAAQGLAQPYLLQQGYYKMPGVTVNGNNIVYDSVSYGINESYNQSVTYYYVRDTQYAYYGVSAASKLWTTHMPDVMYDSVLQRFFSRSDCVGFGCRLLAAVGGTTASTNAYLNLTKRVIDYNESGIAGKNSITTAYSIAIAFPEMTTAEVPGWQYIAGNVEDSMINANRSSSSSLNTYIGLRKGGFANCRPGDVLAFGYGPTASSNGHFMILDSVPTLLNQAGLQSYYPKVSVSRINDFLKKHKVYATSVIDDSGQDAHALDSRKNYSGIGHGMILILTDTADDAPTGFIFKADKTDTIITYNELKDTSYVYAISVGRYISSEQLPVSLSGFTATAKENNVALNWHTASETNTNHFIIERSTNGTDFSEIGNIKAIGSGANSYAFTDLSPSDGINYYRLQTIDADGAATYSKVVSVQLTVASKQFTVYPNPGRDAITINGNHISTVEIIDNQGKVLVTKTLHDASNPAIAINSLAVGVYHLRVQTTDGKVSATNFVKE